MWPPVCRGILPQHLALQPQVAAEAAVDLVQVVELTEAAEAAVEEIQPAA